MTFTIKSRAKVLKLDHPVVMGILNVTPDSFSDGGEFVSAEAAIDHASAMIREGAEIIDVGGESSGPGSADVSEEEELRRVIPVIEAICLKHPEIWISIDTYKSEVARRAIEAGADMVNDVTAFRGDPLMAGTVAKMKVPVILMYTKDSSARTTKIAVHYNDVVATISAFLKERIRVAETAGIDFSRIILDPGMGAFVSMEPRYSFEILERLSEFKRLKRPILVGVSRKSFLGGAGPKDRLEASLAAARLAILHGARIIRAHDVEPTVQMALSLADIHD